MPVLQRLQRTGVRKGFAEGNGRWLAIGVGAWGLRKLKVMSQRQTEILVREELKPGQRIIIANGTATIEQAQSQGATVAEPVEELNQSRKARKQAKQQAAKQAKAAAKAAKR